MARPVAKPRNREQTRRRILQCALDVFAEKGFEGTTVREIARRAEVNHSMIAFYYGSKEKLWNCAVNWLFEETTRAVAPHAGDATLTDNEQFKLLVRRYVAYSAHRPEHARLVMQESLRPGKRLRHIVTLARHHHATVAPLMQRLMENGHIARMDPVSVAYLFSSACQSVFMLAHEARGIYGRQVLSPEFIESHADAVIALFLRK